MTFGLLALFASKPLNEKLLDGGWLGVAAILVM